jgi:predicted GNAT family acetyltransferase
MSMDLDNMVIENNAAAQQFEAKVDGYLAVVEYRFVGENIVFTHTEVPEALAGHGIANKLAHAALEYARAQQLLVVPLCPFVTSYIRHHPEYQTLVEPAFRALVQPDKTESLTQD